jgi:hypothetical protein
MATGDAVDALSDDELASLISKTLERQERSLHHIPRCFPLSQGYVFKIYRDSSQVEDVSRAITTAQALGIRTPSITRSLCSGFGGIDCVQKRVHGPTLMDAWPDLGIVSTLRLAFQLRSMVGRMRTITSPTAGSLGTGICRSIWLDDTFGVPRHAPAATLAAIINFWVNLRSFPKEVSKTREQHQETCAGPVSPEDDLVFTHSDLAPRNIIVEEGTGFAWLIDWDESGYYPRYFEHVGMRNFHIPVSWSWFAKLRWKLFVWIATGWRWNGKKESRMLNEVRRKATGKFQRARRWNIKAGVTPSDRAVAD